MKSKILCGMSAEVLETIPSKTFDTCVTSPPYFGLRNRGKGKLNKVPDRTRMEGLMHNQYEKRNKRDVWNVNTKPFKGSHFAVFPDTLIEPCILAGSPRGGAVLDPFAGSGTTGMVAKRNDRKFLLIDSNPDYCKMAERRIASCFWK